MTVKKNDNLKLWDSVEKTDPSHTKKVFSGGHNFTAIDAYHQIKNATELWGAYGTAWGFSETNIDVINEIENQYTFAKNNGHTNSAIKALELLSRVRGAKSNKDSNISKESLETTIVESLKVLGKEKVVDLLKKCDFV